MTTLADSPTTSRRGVQTIRSTLSPLLGREAGLVMPGTKHLSFAVPSFTHLIILLKLRNMNSAFEFSTRSATHCVIRCERTGTLGASVILQSEMAEQMSSYEWISVYQSAMTASGPDRRRQERMGGRSMALASAS